MIAHLDMDSGCTVLRLPLFNRGIFIHIDLNSSFPSESDVSGVTGH